MTGCFDLVNLERTVSHAQSSRKARASTNNKGGNHHCIQREIEGRMVVDGSALQSGGRGRAWSVVFFAVEEVRNPLAPNSRGADGTSPYLTHPTLKQPQPL